MNFYLNELIVSSGNKPIEADEIVLGAHARPLHEKSGVKVSAAGYHGNVSARVNEASNVREETSD